MKRAIIVRCKQCAGEWYVRESVPREFSAPITITCPHCHTTYHKISYTELYIAPCSKYSILALLGKREQIIPQKTTYSFLALSAVGLAVVVGVVLYIIFHP